MATALLAALLLPATALYAPPTSVRRPSRLQDALTEGNKCYMAGDLAGAKEFYEAGAAAGSVDCRVNLASVCLDSGDEGAAEQLYREALADAFHLDAAQNLAGVLQARGGYESTREASLLLRDVVRADPTRWDAWASLGSARRCGNQPVVSMA